MTYSFEETQHDIYRYLWFRRVEFVSWKTNFTHTYTYYGCFLPTRMSYEKSTKIRNQSTNEFALYITVSDTSSHKRDYGVI